MGIDEKAALNGGTENAGRTLPRVSVITPLFNKGPYVGDTVRSVLAQTLPDWELIVVDNGSTDRGAEVVRQFADPRIRLVSSPRQGPGAARNFGLGLATGEWVLFLDADDLIASDYLQLTTTWGNRHEADLVVSRWCKFADDTGERSPEELPACEGKTPAELLDSAIAFTPWIVHAGLIKRASLRPDLAWPEEMDRYLGEDTVFWFRLLCSQPRWVSRAAGGALYRWKVPGRRTKNEDAAKWFEGVDRGAVSNARHLEAMNRPLTPGQIENLMRLYEDVYRLALQIGNPEIAGRSLALAREWLARCPASPALRPALTARRFFGIRLFNSLRQCVRFAIR